MRFEIIRWEEEEREEEVRAHTYVRTPHIGSVLLEESAFPNQLSLQQAMAQSQMVLVYLQIPIHLHFRNIHLYDANGHVQDDWAFSDLAYYLLLLNSGMESVDSIEAQAYAIQQLLRK